MGGLPLPGVRGQPERDARLNLPREHKASAELEYAVQTPEEAPLSHCPGAGAESEERETAQRGARGPQRVAEEAHREPVPEQSGERSPRGPTRNHATTGMSGIQLIRIV